MVNPIGLSISGTGTGSTRLSLGSFTAGYPIVVSGSEIVSTNSILLDSLSTDSGTLSFIINGLDELKLSGTSLYPSINDGLYLGTNTKRWKSLFNNGQIDGYNPSGNAGMYLSCGTQNSYYCGLFFSSADNNAKGGIRYYTIDPKMYFRLADANYIALSTTAFTPTSNSILNLGDSSYYWKDAYITNGIFKTAILPDTNGGANLGSDTLRFTNAYIQHSLNIESNIGSTHIYMNSTDIGFDPSIYFGVATAPIPLGNITFNTTNTLFEFYVDNTKKLELSSSSLYPSINDGLYLGTNTKRWKSLFNNGQIDGYNPSGNAGMYLSCGTQNSYYCGLFFSSADNNAKGGIRYYTIDPKMYFRLADANYTSLSTTAFTPTSDGVLDLGESATRWDTAYITTIDVPNNFVFKIEGSNELTLSTTSLYPAVDKGLSLGSASNTWQSIYCAGAIYCNANNYAILNLTAATSAHDSIINFGDDSSVNSGIIKYQHSSNKFRFHVNGSEVVTLDSVSFFPQVSGSLTLGATNYKWGTIYNDGKISCYNDSGTAYLSLESVDTDSFVKIVCGTSVSDVSSIYFGNTTAKESGVIKYTASTHAYCKFTFAVDNNDLYYMYAASFHPVVTNTISLGTAFHVWSDIYTQNAPTVISDERQKQNILPINDEVLDAWKDVSIVFYRWIDSVKEKGDDARIHSGVIAQKIKQAFVEHNLDAHRYGLLCYNEWPEKIETTEKTLEDGTIERTNTIIPAGNSYGIRATECLFVEAAYQRRETKQIKEKLNLIEERLVILETKTTSS